jgi:two-component system, OmpR family, alkaline phosphatase synthesis response regulator PhoP
MPKERILVVEDEEDIAELVRYNLSKEGYQVTCVGAGEPALKQARELNPDLILLDLMLPGIDGLDVCREIKRSRETRHIHIVMLTAKGEESDIVTGLELGADDYIAKPFSIRVLHARIRAVLRRDAEDVPDEKSLVNVHGMIVDPVRHTVSISGKNIPLTATEFKILHYLARRPGWVFTRDQIIKGAKGDNLAVTDRSVDVQISSLRTKLGKAGDCIETVRGVGYRFRE